MVHVGLGRSRNRGVVRVRETRKRGYSYTTRTISIPVVLVFVDVIPEHGEDSSNITLDPIISMRVIRRCEYVRDSEQRAYGLEEFRSELFSVIRYQRLCMSVFKQPRHDERYRNRISTDPSQSNNVS